MAVSIEQVESVSAQSRSDVRHARQQQDSLDSEPLRILVAGQTNAGKSTLINALFDQPRAAADVVSCTAGITPYLLEWEGLLSGLIFDTPGYGEQAGWLESNRQELDKTDLLLLVCSANNAARAADERFLREFHRHFLALANRKIPPLIVVVTHIDELRPFREWQPPYDLDAGDNLKSRNIRAALEAIQVDLALPENIVMVPVSLADSNGTGAYNVDTLILAMGRQTDAAVHARLLRCLHTAQGYEKWPRLWQQFGNSGRWLISKAGKVLP